MTRDEKLKMMIEWERSYRLMGEKLDELVSLLGGSYDGPVVESVFKMFDNYTDTLAALIGDYQNWLTWWLFEKPEGAGVVKYPNGDVITVENLSDLLTVIET